MTLKEHLQKAGCSQEQFAKRLGQRLSRPVRQSTVSKLAARKYEPSLDVAEAIIAETGGDVTLRDLKRAR